MSSTYGGAAANVSAALPGAFTITNVSNTVNPTITVSGVLPAAFVTGVTVTIYGVQGAVVVNGTFVATVTGASTFTIVASAPGVYTSGGMVQPLYLATTTIPSDGDDSDAASVDGPFETLSDQTAFLAARGTGAYKLTQTGSAIGVSPSGSSVGNIQVLSLPSSGAWVFTTTGGGFSNPQIDRLVAGDILEIEVVTSAVVVNQNAQSGFLVAPGVAFFSPGVSPPTPTPLVPIAVANPGVATGPITPITLRSVVTVSVGGSVILSVGAERLDGAGTPQVDLYYQTAWYWKVWRPTSMPQ